jgi:hypothetical protein
MGVDVVTNHPGRENVADLVKPELVRRARREPEDRVTSEHTIRLLVVHLRSLEG